MKISEILELYAEAKKPETFRKVKTAVGRLIGSASSWPEKITLLTVEHKRKKLLEAGTKGQTINTYCASLSGMWNWAQQRGYIDRALLNPFKALDNLPGEPEKDIRDLTDSEVSRLLEVSEGLNHLRWALHIYTGLRWNNIHNLLWSQIDDGFIKLPANVMKSKRPLNLPICENLKIILSENREKAVRDRVFKRRSYPTILKYFRKDCEKAGIERSEELGLHSLRHTYATKLYHLGKPILMISRLLDHSSQRVTEDYLHIKAEEMTEAIAGLSY